MSDSKMTITPSWAGVCKNGKSKVCDESLGTDPKKQWFSRGKDLDPSFVFEKGKPYEVLVGVDQFGNQYINGIAGASPSPGFQEDGTPIQKPETQKSVEGVSAREVKTALEILTEFVRCHSV